MAASSLAAGLAPGCGSDDAVDQRAPEGSVAHILPTVSSDRMLIKTSFFEPQEEAPVLRVSGRPLVGQMTDTAGRFWAFDTANLKPARRYTLELRRGDRLLTEPWMLSTFPAASARPQHLRLLVYTCPGGNDIFPFYVPLATRQRLLRRGLDFEPHAVVAIGDHVYWDLRAGASALVTGASATGKAYAGEFDRTVPVLGHANELVLTRAVDPQIAGLYGTMFKSVPVFFIRDDHDYFEDDQVTPALTTFPPDDFMRDLARASQWLYYPEFLPDPQRPLDLPGAAASDRPAGISEAFGTLRYGQLFEGLLYDCKGFMTLGGSAATLTAPAAEAWLLARMAESDAGHVVNFPSNPPGWSAGKYAEWYPDILGPDGMLTDTLPKPGWQTGWLAQHDRLLAAAAARPLPLFFSGDIHGATEGLIVRSGVHDFASNPIVSVITGTLGTGVGWPSIARGTVATSPAHVDVEPIVSVEEVNGFHLIDFEPSRVVISYFRWRNGVDPETAIDTLQPFHISEYRR